MLESTGVVPILHVLAEVGPEMEHDFHPDHDLDFYQSLVDGSGSAHQPHEYPSINFSNTPGTTQGYFGADAAFPEGDDERFVLEAKGYLDVEYAQQGIWTFAISSNDRVGLYVNGYKVTETDALGTVQDKFISTWLERGLNLIRLVYYDASDATDVAALELSAAEGSHEAYGPEFDLVAQGGAGLNVLGGFDVRQRFSSAMLADLGEVEDVLAEPYHNVVDYFTEASNGNLQLAPATAGDLDGIQDGIVGPVTIDAPATESGLKRYLAMQAADADFDFSVYDTNSDGVVTDDELVVMMIFAQDQTNWHHGTVRPEHQFQEDSFVTETRLDGTTGLEYRVYKGKLLGETTYTDHKYLYYAHEHPTLDYWPNAQADAHYQSVVQSLTQPVIDASYESPIVITAPDHGLQLNDRVRIEGVSGNTAANGIWKVIPYTPDTFSIHYLDWSDTFANGSYTSGGTWVYYNYRGAVGGGRAEGISTVHTNDGVDLANGFMVGGIEQWGSLAVHAHEISHVLHPDAMDLYNLGVDRYSLMGPSYPGIVHHDPWTKLRLGWVTPTTITTPTTVTLSDVETTGQVLKIPVSSQEYFLVENRWGGNSYEGATRAESDIPGFPHGGIPDEGLAIWHIDETLLQTFRDESGAGGPFTIPGFIAREDRAFPDDLFDDTQDFDALTTPNSNLNNGTPSDVVITQISPPGKQMSLRIEFGGLPEDHLEPNSWTTVDRFLGAGDVVEPNLTIHRADDDWYRWIAPASGTVTINTLFEHYRGNLDLMMFESDGTTFHAGSTSASDNEQITTSVTVGQTYYIHVYGVDDAINTYDLLIDAPTIPGDRFEYNGIFDSATVFGAGDHTEANLSIHASDDQDYFRWVASDAGSVVVELAFLDDMGDLDLIVYDESRTIIGSSTSSTDDEQVTVTASAAGDVFYVRVYGYGGATNGDYELSIDGPDVPPDVLEPNAGFEFAKQIGTGDQSYQGLTIHSAHKDDYYRWVAPDDGILTVDILFSHARGDLDLYLYDDDHVQLDSSASSSDNEQCQIEVAKGGNYFVRVQGYNGALHDDYDLLIDGPDILPDRFEPNELFFSAAMLGTGDLIETGLTIHDGDAGDCFSWVAPAAGTLDVNLFSDPFAGNLDLYIYDFGMLLLDDSTGTSGTEHVTAPVASQGQRFFIVVVGAGGDLHHDYTLSINGPDVPADALEDNDTFITATDLGFRDVTYTNLTIDAIDDPDFFRFTAENDGTLDVDLLFDHAIGNLELSAWIPLGIVQGQPWYRRVADSTSTTDDEHVSITVVRGETYYIKVHGYDQAVHYNYTLEVDGPGIAPDAFEPNDGIGSSFDLMTGDQTHTQLSVHEPDNYDFFKWTAPATGDLTIDVFFEHAVGDLDVVLYDSTGAPIDWSDSQTDNEHIPNNLPNVTVTQGEVYYIRVVGYNGAVNPDYTLVIDGPGEVPPDALEANDTQAQATWLGIGDWQQSGLTLHGPQGASNHDWYRWVAPATGSVTVDVAFQHVLGDVDVELHDAEQMLASATGTDDLESITASVYAGSTYYVRVYGAGGATQPDYALSLDGPEILADAFESNDSFAEAAYLGYVDQTHEGLTIHTPGNDDYYRWIAPADGTLNVDLLFVHEYGDLDLGIFDSSFGRLVDAESEDDNEHGSTAVTKGETYYIHVNPFQTDQHFDYDLVIDGPEIPDDGFEPNDSFAEAAYLGYVDQTHEGLTVHTPGNDDYYRWIAPADGTLNVDLLFVHEYGDLDLKVYDSGLGLIIDEDSIDDNEHGSTAVTKGETYYIRVAPYITDLHFDYDLVIDGPEVEPDALEPNDSFAQAWDLGWSDQTRESLTVHAPGNDDYYRWIAPADGTLNVDLLFVHEYGDLELVIYDAGFGLLDRAISTSDNEYASTAVTKGETYFIRVDPYQDAQHFDYDLVIDGPDPADVVGRHLFYNNSAYDGASDDDAIAWDKMPLMSSTMPGTPANLTNYTNYAHGINGIMVDVEHLASTPALTDFEFRVGNDNDPAGWTLAPDPTAITVRPGEGEGGSDRVTIVWADGQIKNQWLQVTVLSNAHGGNLSWSENDVFYFGNAVGETANDGSNALVTAADVIALRDHFRGPANRADITSPYDIDRDRLVDAVDMVLARNHATGPFDGLRLIDPPLPAPPPAEAEGEQRLNAVHIESPTLPALTLIARTGAVTSGRAVAQSLRSVRPFSDVIVDHAAQPSIGSTLPASIFKRNARALGRQSTEMLPEQSFAEIDDPLADLLSVDWR